MPGYITQIIVSKDNPVPLEEGDGTVLLTVKSDGPVYYGTGSSVSATNNQGSITSGNSHLFGAPTWLRAAKATPCSLFYTSGVGPTVAELAFASTVTPTVGPGETILNVGTLTADITVNAPAGFPFDAQTLRLRFTQDASGNHAVNFAAAYAFGTDVTADLIPPDATSGFEMVFSYHAAAGVWRALAITRGF